MRVERGQYWRHRNDPDPTAYIHIDYVIVADDPIIYYTPHRGGRELPFQNTPLSLFVWLYENKEQT